MGLNITPPAIPADRETWRWTASTKIPRRCMLAIASQSVPTITAFTTILPPNLIGEEIENLRQAAGPPNEGGVESPQPREEIRRVSLEELDVASAGASRLGPGIRDRLRSAVDRVDPLRRLR